MDFIYEMDEIKLNKIKLLIKLAEIIPFILFLLV